MAIVNAQQLLQTLKTQSVANRFLFVRTAKLARIVKSGTAT